MKKVFHFKGWREKCKAIGDQIDRALEKLVDHLVKAGVVVQVQNG